jgi:hypothetical protein
MFLTLFLPTAAIPRRGVQRKVTQRSVKVWQMPHRRDLEGASRLVRTLCYKLPPLAGPPLCQAYIRPAWRPSWIDQRLRPHDMGVEALGWVGQRRLAHSAAVGQADRPVIGAAGKAIRNETTDLAERTPIP